jgi:putative transposase
MPINQKLLQPFCPGDYLHLVCKSVGDVWLFRSEENRRYFLEKYFECTRNYLDTYAYCLLANHTHWLVRCKQEAEVKALLGPEPEKPHQRKFVTGALSFEKATEKQLKDFFIGYALAYNKMYDREGGLFQKPFKRIRVQDEAHFKQLVIYIHLNVLKHGTSKQFETYPWSSYQHHLSDAPTLLKRQDVLDRFGGREGFVQAHRAAAQGMFQGIQPSPV